MKILRNIIPILILILIFSFNLNSQSIKLVRTDVDSARANFVTATYMFGFDVVIDGVKNCNGVEFELAFNNTNYVHYSDWKVGGFGENATTVVIPIIDTLSNSGKVYVLVISGDPIHEAKLSDTTVIHLDFVVSQKAEHGRQVTFVFNNAHATVYQDSIGVVLDLDSEPFVYDIHGFVNVWPGDTDNNGIVDEVDMDMIALHLFHGASTKKMRSFKRENASTLWHAQRVLAWDSAEVTYADCDGDANITAYDMLVIPLNFAEQHGIKKNNNGKVQSNFVNYKYEKSADSYEIPVFISPNDEFIASYFRFKWSGEDFKILGFEKSNYFDSDEFLYADIDNDKKEAYVLVGNYGRKSEIKSGNLFKVVVDKRIDIINSYIKEAVAVTPYRDFIHLDFNAISDVNYKINTEDYVSFYENNWEYYIEFSKNLSGELSIFNLLGTEVFTEKFSGNFLSFNKSQLNRGFYLIVLNTEIFLKTFKIWLD